MSSVANANASVTEISNTLVNAKENRAGHVPQLHQQIDRLLEHVALWPAPDRLRLTQPIRDAAAQFQEHAETTIERLSTELASAQETAATDLAKWREESDEQLAKLVATNDELASKVAEATTELASQRQRLDTALNENSAAYQAAEKERTAGAKKAADAANLRHDDMHSQIKTDGEARVAQMDELLAQARKTLETIGVDSTAGHYSTYANEQRGSANVWRRVAVSSLALSAGAFILAFFLGSDSWHDTALRVGLAAAFVGIAGYAGTQSAGHRREERKAQRFALGLNAMESYLANVEATPVDDLKVKLAELLFIADAEPDRREATGLPPTASVIGQIVDGVVKGLPKGQQ
ncbi:MAG TPA: hypothetical protein VIM10_03095 [Actinopolymorphaceae bacterium]